MVSCLIYNEICEELNMIFMAVDTNYEMRILAYSKIDCLFSKEKPGISIHLLQAIWSHSAIFRQVLLQKIVF